VIGSMDQLEKEEKRKCGDGAYEKSMSHQSLSIIARPMILSSNCNKKHKISGVTIYFCVNEND